MSAFLLGTLFAGVLVETSNAQEHGPAPLAIDSKATLANGVVFRGDIPFASPPTYRPLTLDIYTPPKPGLKPAVIFVHGGGWMAGTTRTSELFGADWPPIMVRLASSGYVVASVAYRLSGEAKFPAQLQDVNAAVRWVKAQAPSLGIDPNRIVLWGASAGAQISLLTALDCKTGKLAEKGAPAEPSTCVRALVDWFGPSDFTTIAEQGSVIPWGKADSLDVLYLGCSTAPCDPEMLRRASPVNYVTADAPPILIVHGDTDTAVSAKQSEQLIAKLRAAGAKVEYKTVKGADHGFRGASPAEAEGALRATFDFIAAQTR
jgi:acetyl esterase/lipase